MVDLTNLSLAELRQLAKQVAAAISSFEQRKKQDARAQLEARAKELGFALSDLAKAPAAVRKVAAKWRHPEDPSLTWTGRGRKPAWIVEHLSAHGNLDALRIEH